ncbi:hypothetical protein RRG08_049458 [Elysia crispata]|uniref:Uncharacterized protein n=1 Tax=Elysia crispata TaxID=231223 RepID=A0AAE0ZTY1_9GAST|nr:hypothetical protein RRG08_049458 [Elysia crispata]
MIDAAVYPQRKDVFISRSFVMNGQCPTPGKSHKSSSLWSPARPVPHPGQKPQVLKPVVPCQASAPPRAKATSPQACGPLPGQCPTPGKSHKSSGLWSPARPVPHPGQKPQVLKPVVPARPVPHPGQKPQVLKPVVPCQASAPPRAKATGPQACGPLPGQCPTPGKSHRSSSLWSPARPVPHPGQKPQVLKPVVPCQASAPPRAKATGPQACGPLPGQCPTPGKSHRSSSLWSPARPVPHPGQKPQVLRPVVPCQAGPPPRAKATSPPACGPLPLAARPVPHPGQKPQVLKPVVPCPSRAKATGPQACGPLLKPVVPCPPRAKATGPQACGPLPGRWPTPGKSHKSSGLWSPARPVPHPGQKPQPIPPPPPREKTAERIVSPSDAHTHQCTVEAGQVAAMPSRNTLVPSLALPVMFRREWWTRSHEGKSRTTAVQAVAGIESWLLRVTNDAVDTGVVQRRLTPRPGRALWFPHLARLGDLAGGKL